MKKEDWKSRCITSAEDARALTRSMAYNQCLTDLINEMEGRTP